MKIKETEKVRGGRLARKKNWNGVQGLLKIKSSDCILNKKESY